VGLAAADDEEEVLVGVGDASSLPAVDGRDARF
jgi:hypothetical protein